MDEEKLKPRGKPLTSEQLAQLAQITVADVVAAVRSANAAIRPYLESTRDR